MKQTRRVFRNMTKPYPKNVKNIPPCFLYFVRTSSSVRTHLLLNHCSPTNQICVTMTAIQYSMHLNPLPTTNSNKIDRFLHITSHKIGDEEHANETRFGEIPPTTNVLHDIFPTLHIFADTPFFRNI